MTTKMTHQMLLALENIRTYLGNDKHNEVAAIGGGKWVWRFTEDPHFGGQTAAYTGTLEECEELKREYDNPTLDFPF
jgi:hypothetical protein